MRTHGTARFLQQRDETNSRFSQFCGQVPLLVMPCMLQFQGYRLRGVWAEYGHLPRFVQVAHLEVRVVHPFFGLENCRQSSWLRDDAPIFTVPYGPWHRRPRRSRLRTFRKSSFVPSLRIIHIFGASDFRVSRPEGAFVGGDSFHLHGRRQTCYCWIDTGGAQVHCVRE